MQTLKNPQSQVCAEEDLPSLEKPLLQQDSPKPSHPTDVPSHSVLQYLDSLDDSGLHGTGLALRTESTSSNYSEFSPSSISAVSVADSPFQPLTSSTNIPVRSSSVRSTLSASHHKGLSLSPNSALSSPNIGSIVDITPLPSPATNWNLSAHWGAARGPVDLQEQVIPEGGETYSSKEASQEPTAFTRPSPKKYKAQLNPSPLLGVGENGVYRVNATAHARNRSLSDYVPDAIQVTRNRNIVVSGSGPALVEPGLPVQRLHREEYLAVKRGLTPFDSKPVTDQTSIPNINHVDPATIRTGPDVPQKPSVLYEAYSVRTGQCMRWREIRTIGQGTFSTVVLATSEIVENNVPTREQSPLTDENRLPAKSLVAIKICSHGPSGGADAEKIKTSLDRELEIMKSINHACLVHLCAVNILTHQTLLVLRYCSGGDLYDLASKTPELLVPSLIRRIFAELIAATRCLHSQLIVHRDIKLENILVNIPQSLISQFLDWQSYPHPVITLTDLGLSRRISLPPESPLLTTRCGSEDYAAPEILLGQPYDGRATDAWALGVVLYAMMEDRLPFDPLPNAKRTTAKTHRVARCEWSWWKWAGADGEWDQVKGKELEGGRAAVESLLVRARSRTGLDEVATKDWVKGGMTLEGELKRATYEEEEQSMLQEN